MLSQFISNILMKAESHVLIKSIINENSGHKLGKLKKVVR